MKFQSIMQDMSIAFAVREQAIARGTHDHIVFGYLGIPGVGKTAKIIQAAARHNARVIQLLGSALSPTDIVATSLGDDDLLRVQYNAEVPWESTVGDEKIVWFLDECTNMHAEVWKSFQKLIHERALGSKVLGPNVVIVLAGNRASDKAGSTTVSSAVYNRVTWREWDYNNAEFIEYLSDRYDTPVLTAYFSLKEMGETDFTDALKMMGKAPYVQWASPRSVERLAQRLSVASTMGVTLSVTDIAGDIGIGRAGEYVAFEDKVQHLPPLSKVLADPEHTQIPDKVDMQFAMLAMLVQKTDKDIFPQLATYVRRMDVSLQVLYLKLINKRKVDGKEIAPTIKILPAYRDWLADKAILEAMTGRS